jgi:hypothetical protein
VPVERADAARNNGSHVRSGLLTAVADYCLPIITLLEKVRQLFVTILPPEVFVSTNEIISLANKCHSLSGLGSSDFLVIAVGSSFDALKAGL